MKLRDDVSGKQDGGYRESRLHIFDLIFQFSLKFYSLVISIVCKTFLFQKRLMSWFDTSSFSSFAKTALSQAHNLQKSIDRVLDIEDDKKDAVSKLSSGKFTISSYYCNFRIESLIS